MHLYHGEQLPVYNVHQQLIVWKSEIRKDYVSPILS